jgi:nicotinate-nucleotide adenylyltransferase
MAEEARVAYKLDKVLFVPAGRPPHKATYQVTSPEHRYAMTLLGTASNQYFEVSRIELERDGPSYSVDTIQQLRSAGGESTEVYFIIGADEALDLPKWHEANRLPKLARFLVAPRPGFGLADLQVTLPAEFLAAIDILPMSAMEICSTGLRARCASGQSIKYLVPENVEAYILKHGLYARAKRGLSHFCEAK